MTGIVALILSAPALRNVLKVSLVVGNHLNLISQGATISRGGAPEGDKLALNGTVPSRVPSYSVARAGAQ